MVRRLTRPCSQVLSTHKPRYLQLGRLCRQPRPPLLTRCGSRRMATPLMRRAGIPVAARQTCSPGTESAGWFQRKWRGAAIEFQHGLFSHRKNDGRRARRQWAFTYVSCMGDMPYVKELADHYSMSDNYHQPVMGGTGANMQSCLVSATPSGSAMKTEIQPSHRTMNSFGWHSRRRYGGRIEDPNPCFPGTNNWWIQDGYGGGGFGSAIYGGGSYKQLLGPLPTGFGPDPWYDLSFALEHPIQPQLR